MSKRTRFCLTGCVVIALPLTVSGLAKVAIFTTNVDAENQTLINHKCACGAMNRHFCQTRVMRSCFLPRSIFCNIYKSVVFITICSTISHKPKSTMLVFVNLKSQRTIISFCYSILCEFLTI